MILFIPGRLVNHGNASGIRSRHWHIERGYQAMWAQRAWALALAELRRAGGPAFGWRREQPKRLTLVCRVGGLMDYGGLVRSTKGLLDGLVAAGLLCDDGLEHGHLVEYQREVTRRGRGVEITATLRAGEPCTRADHDKRTRGRRRR